MLFLFIVHWVMRILSQRFYVPIFNIICVIWWPKILLWIENWFPLLLKKVIALCIWNRLGSFINLNYLSNSIAFKVWIFAYIINFSCWISINVWFSHYCCWSHWVFTISFVFCFLVKHFFIHFSLEKFFTCKALLMFISCTAFSKILRVNLFFLILFQYKWILLVNGNTIFNLWNDFPGLIESDFSIISVSLIELFL